MNMLTMGKTFTLEERLDKTTGDLLDGPNGEARYRAMAGLIMLGQVTVSEDAAVSAYTDGRNEVYGRPFCSILPDAELRFIRVHENKHKMYKHPSLFKWLFDIAPEKAGIALDHVITLEILAENPDECCRMPTAPDGTPMGFADPKYKGKDAVQVFWDIYNERKGGDQEGEGGGGSGEPNDDGSGGTGISNEPHNFDSHEHFNAEMTPEETKELDRAIEDAIRQGVLAAGKSGKAGDLDLGKLVKPKLNWRKELREFIKSQCKGRRLSTYRRPNRRFMGSGVYLPSYYDERVDDLVIAGDTSGSMMRPEQWSLVVSEMHGALTAGKPELVHIMYWDWKVRGHEQYKDVAGVDGDAFLKSTRPKGGGGTDVVCLSDYIKEHKMKPQCVVIITDGRLSGGQGQWDVPVLWVVVDNPTFKCKQGRVLHVEGNDIR